MVQPWAKSKDRKKFALYPVNPTEEGLASLHTVLLRQDPLLFRYLSFILNTVSSTWASKVSLNCTTPELKPRSARLIAQRQIWFELQLKNFTFEISLNEFPDLDFGI